jgi:hypothetical protein
MKLLLLVLAALTLAAPTLAKTRPQCEKCTEYYHKCIAVRLPQFIIPLAPHYIYTCGRCLAIYTITNVHVKSVPASPVVVWPSALHIVGSMLLVIRRSVGSVRMSTRMGCIYLVGW